MFWNKIIHIHYKNQILKILLIGNFLLQITQKL